MNLNFFDRHDRAAADALAEMNCPTPDIPEAKEEIRQRVFKVLRIKPEWMPQISWDSVKTEKFDSFSIETLRFRSWQNIYGDVSLYLPKDTSQPLPAMFFSPGHSPAGRFCGQYQSLARMLAAHGVAVFIFDQFGHGGRKVLAHQKQFDVFSCGTTISGLMVLEDMALFNALSADPRFDSGRIGLIGDSGGGQNTIFLTAALWDKAALSIPVGFACSYEYGARKMRHLCECNIFPGILHEFETWHALGCIHPKPLLIASGINDSMIARDVVLNLKYRMQAIYGDDPNFEQFFWNGSHQWTAPAHALMMNFILRHFGLPEDGENIPVPTPLYPEYPETPPLPADLLTLGELAGRLTGKKPQHAEKLADVFPIPDYLSPEEFNSLPENLQDIFIQSSTFL